MGDYFDWWIGGGTWYDRKQQEALDALQASQARTSSRLRSQLREEARRSQDLQTRLSKLEDAVIASIELEDLRGVMENFSDAVATRQYARDVLARIPALGRVASQQSPQVPPDMPDYWLHPAVRSVDAGLRGDSDGERGHADEARRRDPVRTAQFLAAVAILRRTAVADDDLATLWPAGRQVSRYQRSLWLAVANSGLGEEARDSLVSALRWTLSHDREQREAVNDPLRLVRAVQSGPAYEATPLEDLVVDELIGVRAPSTPQAAAEALETLRERVETAMAGARSTTAADEVPEGVADLLAQVVSAGAPAEEPLVARIIELRQAIAAIGASTSIATPGLLDDESLDVVELLRADLADGSDPGAHGVAVRVLREQIERVGARLADAAAQQQQDAATLRVAGGVTVELSSLGPTDARWREHVVARVRHQVPSNGGAIGKLVSGGVLAVLGVVLGVAFSPGWYVLLVAGGALAGYGYWEMRRNTAEAQRRTAAALEQADEQIGKRSSELAGEIALARERQLGAPEELRRIRASLAATSSPTAGTSG